MSKMMKWLLLSTLVSLSEGRFCSRSSNCTCLDVEYRKWEIRCPTDSNPKFIARFDIDDSVGRVECRNATSWSELGYQSSSRSFYAGWTLRIERCPLPDESFNNVTNRLGLKSPGYLTFTSHMNLSSTLTRRHLSMLSDVTILNLSSNGLTELPSDLFRDLGWLSDLDLSFNKIAMLPHDIFHGHSTLWTIDLSYNVMKFVDWRLFHDCTELFTLSLRGNLLTTLDHRTFHGCTQLDLINLAENLLQTLPHNAFEYAKTLALDISGNRFSTLPEELFSRSNLTKLRFHHNHGNLTTLPENFLNNITCLEEVNLARNNLTDLSEDIFWGSFSLLAIDLHGNALSTLPKDMFRDSRELIYLDLSGNGLNYLPEGLFRALSKLWKLNLARNGLISLSGKIFTNLDSLLELDLGFNKIVSIERNTFRTLPSIRIIRLSQNSLGLTETGILKSLGHYVSGSTIPKIFLDHNNLTGSFFIGNDDELPGNFQLVDLTYNQITEVSVYSSLIGSHDAEYDLRHNNIRSIEIDDKMSSRVNILVDDNPFYCGCTMYNSLEYHQELGQPQFGQNLQIILGNASCSEPDWMQGTPVASLRLETFACRPDDDNRHVRCAVGCDCWWRPHDKTRIVDCSSKTFEKMPDEVIEFVDDDDVDSDELRLLYNYVDEKIMWHDWCETRVELNLTNNSLTEISTLNGSAYEHVEFLILSHNNVSKLSFDVLPPRLKILWVDHNDLRTLNATTVEAVMESTYLREVNLEGNPWKCDGETRNRLASLEEKFGNNVLYSFDMRSCLDSRQKTSSERNNGLYISFVRF